MKKVTCFKTTDEKIFENRTEAEKHQHELDLGPALKKFFDKKDISEDLIQYVLNNRDELLRILYTKKTKKKKTVTNVLNNSKTGN